MAFKEKLRTLCMKPFIHSALALIALLLTFIGTASAGSSNTLVCTGAYSSTANATYVIYNSTQNTCTISNNGSIGGLGNVAIWIGTTNGRDGTLYSYSDTSLNSGTLVEATADHDGCSYAGESIYGGNSCAFYSLSSGPDTATITAKVSDRGSATLSVTFSAVPGTSISITSASISGVDIPPDLSAPTGYSVAFDQLSVNASNQNAVSFSFSDAEIGTTYSYSVTSLTGGSAVTGTGTIASVTDSIQNLNLSNLGDGAIGLSVTLTDTAGNVGQAATASVLKDATVPTGHGVAFDQPGINASNESAASFTFSGAELGTTYNYVVTSSGGLAAVIGTGTVVTGTDTIQGVNLTPLNDGTLTLSVTLTDSAGNVSPSISTTVLADTIKPNAPGIVSLALASNSGSTSDLLTNNTAPVISGIAEANTTIEIFVDGTSVGTGATDGAGNWTFTFQGGDLAGGVNTITATATDAAGNVSVLSNGWVITIDADVPTVTIDGPTEAVTTDFSVTFTFSETVTGFDASDVIVANGTLGAFSGSGASYTLVITPQLGTVVAVSVSAGSAQDAAANDNAASNVFEVQAGSPASEFAASEEDIRNVIVDEATRSLKNTLAFNQRIVREARERFIERQSQSADEAIGSDIPLDINGTFDAGTTTMSSKGTFFGQRALGMGKQRIVSGDFAIQQDKETGSSTATLNGKIAWEQSISDKTTLGYFVGGELARSNIAGTFDGDQKRLGLNVGTYAVHEVAERIYLDGFVSIGAGRNNLTMTNGVLDLDSDYTTRTATLGAALSGVIEQKGYEIWPELSFSYGRTWIGDVGFTGRAYGLVDDSLSLDAGTVTLANIMFRPEFRVPADGLSAAESLMMFTFAPKLICEQVMDSVAESNCGSGAEFGFASTSDDGLSTASTKFVTERIGDETSSTVQLNIDYRF